MSSLDTLSIQCYRESLRWIVWEDHCEHELYFFSVQYKLAVRSKSNGIENAFLFFEAISIINDILLIFNFFVFQVRIIRYCYRF